MAGVVTPEVPAKTITAATSAGYVTIADVTGFYAGAHGFINKAGQATHEVIFTEVLTTTNQLGIRFVLDPGQGQNYGRDNVSAYSGGTVSQFAQLREPEPPGDDIPGPTGPQGPTGPAGADGLDGTDLNWLSVKAYGAIGDGVTDDTAAVAATIAAANALVMAGSSGIYGTGAIASGTIPTVYFPSGVYKVTSALTSVTYMNLVGDQAIIVASSDSNTIFSAIKFQTNIRGLTFRRGATALAIATGNVDTTVITVEDCEFVEQQSKAIVIDSTSSSTLLNVSRSKFYQATTTAYCLYADSGDRIVFEDCWVSAAGYAFYLNGPSSHTPVLSLNNILGVPLDATKAWVYTAGTASVRAWNFRFGGELGGKPLVEGHAGPDLTYPENATFIDIQDCEGYAASTFAVKLYDIPNVVRIRNNPPLIDTYGIYYDAAIPAATIRALGTLCIIDVDTQLPIGMRMANGNSSNSAAIATRGAMTMRRSICQPQPNHTDLIACMTAGSNEYGLNETDVSVTTAGVTNNAFAHSEFQSTATADGGYSNLLHTRLSTLLSNGVYTFVFELEAVTNPVDLELTLAGTTSRMWLPRGRHVVSIPFIVDASTTSHSYGVKCILMKSGDVARFGLYKVFSGLHDIKTSNTVCVGANASITNGQWFKGDLIINSAPSSGTPTDLVCTTAGWLAPAWAASTAYSLDHFRTNDTGKIYKCTTAGTSASSGGPTGTGGSITDGTVVWQYVGVTAVFSAR